MNEKELFVLFKSVINKSLSSYCHYFFDLPLGNNDSDTKDDP